MTGWLSCTPRHWIPFLWPSATCRPMMEVFWCASRQGNKENVEPRSSLFNPLKGRAHLNNIQKFGSYLIENTPLIHYKLWLTRDNQEFILRTVVTNKMLPVSVQFFNIKTTGCIWFWLPIKRLINYTLQIQRCTAIWRKPCAVDSQQREQVWVHKCFPYHSKSVSHISGHVAAWFPFQVNFCWPMSAQSFLVWALWDPWPQFPVSLSWLCVCSRW
jgi:hypothetical protein